MNGVEVTGQLAPNTAADYMCTDPTTFIRTGSATNECNDQGAYINEAPTCPRSESVAWNWKC